MTTNYFNYYILPGQNKIQVILLEEHLIIALVIINVDFYFYYATLYNDQWPAMYTDEANPRHLSKLLALLRDHNGNKMKSSLEHIQHTFRLVCMLGHLYFITYP